MSQDPYRYFRVEARELVDHLGRAVLDLEKGARPEIVAGILRLAHTLKGAARVVKQGEIGDGAHAIEEVLTPCRDGTTPVDRERIDLLFGLVDAIGGRVGALASPDESGNAAPVPGRPEELVRTVRAEIAEMDDLLEGISEAHAQVEPLRASLGEVGRAVHLAECLAAQLEIPGSGQSSGAREGAARGKARATAGELRALLPGLERKLAMGIDRIEREIRQVRGAAEQMRLVPAGSLFTPLERTARDAAQALGKSVVFVGRGGDVRLDARVLEVIQGALTQVVRNAVAHGIEPEDDRRAAGKPTRGTVTLDVTRRGRRVVFTGGDDGRGVDLEAVRRVARRKGLIPSEARDLGVEDLLRLLLKGGISTSSS